MPAAFGPELPERVGIRAVVWQPDRAHGERIGLVLAGNVQRDGHGDIGLGGQGLPHLLYERIVSLVVEKVDGVALV